MCSNRVPTAEDNLNISLKEITVTGRDGRVSQLDQVYIRGSMIRFFIVPDMLQNAPMCVTVRFLTSLAKRPQVQTGRPQCYARQGYWHCAWTCDDYARCVLVLLRSTDIDGRSCRPQPTVS